MTDALETAQSMLLVDDDEVFRRRLGQAFASRGFEVREAGGKEEAVRLATEESPELAVVDLRMADGNGLEVVAALAEIDATTKTVVLTGYGSIATALEAVRLGAKHYLTKPATCDEIIAAFARDESAPIAGAAAIETDVPSLARVEWEHINRVLTDVNGNVSQAARLLGLHRRSLQRKLAKYPVSR